MYNVMDLSLNELIREIEYCKNVLENQEEEINAFKDSILNCTNKFKGDDKTRTKIFVGGAGRSGLVAKSFAMRLMQLGFTVYVFGESIVPPIDENDVIITISKSGESGSVKDLFKNYKLEKVNLLTVCGDESCDMANISDSKVILPEVEIKLVDDEKERLDKLNFNYDELVLLGSAFETTAYIFLDVLVVELMQALELEEKDLKDMHDNLSSYIN